MNIQTKTLLFICVFSMLLFSAIIYNHSESFKKTQRELYKSEARIIAHALESNIISKSSLENKQDLSSIIKKQILLNDNLLEIRINLLNESKMTTLVSNNRATIGTIADLDNLAVFENDTLISKIININDKKVLRTIAPIRISGETIGTYQIDSSLEQMYKDMVKNRRHLLVLYFLGWIIFVSLFSLFFIKTINYPLTKIFEATQRISNQDFKTKIDIDSHDEFEKIGDIINKSMEELEKIDMERKQLDKAKSEFLSITSHELRSPMTPMKAQLQMLLEEYFGRLNEKQKEAVEIVLRNTERLDRIIVDFLEISRIEAAKLKFNFVKTNLTPHITRLLGEMKGFMPEKKVEIVANIEKLPVIETDPDRIMQVLRNLLNNAIKFSKENSKVSLDVHQNGKFIQFSVKDFGIGIKPEAQLRMFEPFFQAEQTIYRKYSGTGLGLAISKGIIESQKGEIWFRSEYGKSTTFYFTVPFKPVKETEPISVLFSRRDNVEREIKKILLEELGPLGEQEFNELRERGLTKENALIYLKKMFAEGIIDKERRGILKEKILSAITGKAVKGKIVEEKIEKFFTE